MDTNWRISADCGGGSRDVVLADTRETASLVELAFKEQGCSEITVEPVRPIASA